MESQRKNSAIWIDEEALATLKLVKGGILSPVEGLMNEREAKEVDKTGIYKNVAFPFSFILAPNGKKNKIVLKKAKKNDRLDLIVNGKVEGYLIVDEVFEIDLDARVEKIFGTRDLSNPDVYDTYERLGKYAVSGEYFVDTTDIDKMKEKIKKAKEISGAKKVSAIMMAAKPLHRAHERLIRSNIECEELLIIFLLKPYQLDFLSYELRYRTVKFFVENFLPKNRVLILPFENTYLFAGINDIILDSICAKNFGCDRIIIGQNHPGVGLFYDSNSIKSITDSFFNIDIEVKTVSEFVYCNQCKTLVSENTCPHGKHHHISYHSESIQELLKEGIIPPAVLIRKEISAMLLSKLYPNRFNNLQKLFADLVPNSGLLENHNDKEFYEELLKLYQTVSLT